MIKKTILSISLIVSVTATQAALISHTDITATTSLAQSNQPGYDFNINKIADGVTSDAAPYNGFASSGAHTSGIITLNLSQAFDLTSFVLWNDINVVAEGITSFELSFYNGLGGLISTTGTYNVLSQGVLAGQTFNFASTVSGVSKVNLNVLSVNPHINVTGIEIREVSFHGSVSNPSVPDTGSTFALLSLGFLSIVGFRRLRK